MDLFRLFHRRDELWTTSRFDCAFSWVFFALRSVWYLMMSPFELSRLIGPPSLRDDLAFDVLFVASLNRLTCIDPLTPHTRRCFWGDTPDPAGPKAIALDL